jgi:IMP dehydrogenase
MKGLDFDDVLLLPVPSEINSRDEVNIRFETPLLNLEVPLIAAPMASIINSKFAITLGKLGGLAILHRFLPKLERLVEIDTVANAHVPFGVAISSHEDDLDIARYALDHGANIICVDVANGYTRNLRNYLVTIKPIINSYKALLMSGNVATLDGYFNLIESGVDLVRVGIGSGALCTTRNKTGIGVPQITAISNCHNNGSRTGYLVADGGIRNSGDAIKAFAFGADLVIIGTTFSTTYESAHNGHIYGMASKELQEQFYGRVKSVEGLSKTAEKNISLKDFVDDFSYSLKSACTYLNIRTLSELKNKVTYLEVGSNSIKVL